MTKEELKQRLINENIPTDTYSLNGRLPNEVYCIGENGDAWEVYYSERGSKTDLNVFKTEEEACDYYYNRLIKLLKSMGIIS